MPNPEISKSNTNINNLQDYFERKKNFDWWSDAFNQMDWLPGGGLNNAYEAIDRHVKNGFGDRVAMIWVGKNDEEEQYSFLDIKNKSDQFGSVIRGLGMERGDRVFIFMDRLPELYISALGVLKAGGVIAPLFSAFGPDPVRDRMEDAGAKYLITSPELRNKLNDVLPKIKTLKNVIVVNKNGRHDEVLVDGDLSYETLMESEGGKDFEIEPTSQYDFSIMHYTSGSTGKPKGVLHRHQAVVQQWLTGKWALDLKFDDIYFCTADPGWVTGTSYGIMAPWTNGVTQLIYEGGFGAQSWYKLIEKYKVTVWYTAPTAIRLLMRAGSEVVEKFDMSSLRFIGSVGEPLNPEAVIWGNKNYKMPIHDNWWQTETGAIMCANYASMPVRPGSMGRPIPGVEMAVIDESFNPLPTGEVGALAVRPGWPSMMYGYWQKDEMYNSRFKKGWYITGDQASIDEDGYFWFQGRADDVINTAGHLVGPFEVESALIEHPAVAEAGVIGKPDPIAMEVVKAFVTLNTNYEPNKELRRELIRFARDKLSAGVAPREIDFIDTMPKTRSGKIMRRLLKARELGLPEGDTSTLEDD
ncbi:MAG: acetate--CoA ligase [Dehalococcoidia bacterium]|jgi:acetyl-CoA synthetase|nr:acetate--CoA ligase [Chloroflexota bacterium]MDP6425757.1 acetate--CoA ligase [Dehalococcoidia bacterium]MDP7231455.1 acetate--CoA ligase [Dehalococcoidia bacterium]MDP7613558.1 acetate--CoA ligase [Dehalococcoidia bacterium]